MLAQIMTGAFAILFGGFVAALLFTLPHLAAAWAAVSRRPTHWRLLLTIGVWAAFFIVYASIGEYAFSVLVGLSMLAVALPLWLVRLKGEGRLRFTLVGVFQIITGIALLLGLSIQPALHKNLPAPWAFTLGGLVCATTLVAITVARSGRPKLPRAVALCSWLLVASLMVGRLELDPYTNLEARLLFVGMLAYHGLMIWGATVLWGRLQTRREHLNELPRSVCDGEG